MTTRPTKKCRECTREFEASRTDYTVRCPDCRAARRAPKERTFTVAAPETVTAVGRTCTVRTATAGMCGRPAVTAFRTSTDEVFAECEEHAA